MDRSGTLAYPHEKLSDAVRSLITEPGDARERLAHATRFLLRLDASDLPAAVRPDFVWVLSEVSKRDPDRLAERFARVTGVPVGKHGATLARMRNSTALKIMARIWKIREVVAFQYISESA